MWEGEKKKAKMNLAKMEQSTQELFQGKIDHAVEWFTETEKIVEGWILQGEIDFKHADLALVKNMVTNQTKTGNKKLEPVKSVMAL